MFFAEFHNKKRIAKRHIFENEPDSSTPLMKIKKIDSYSSDQQSSVNIANNFALNNDTCPVDFNDMSLSITPPNQDIKFSETFCPPEKITDTNIRNQVNTGMMTKVNNLSFCKQDLNLKAPENPHYYEYNKLLFNLHIERVQRSISHLHSSPN